MQRSLSIIADFIQAQKPTEQLAAQILGVHLEGPFLNRAHPAEYLLPLTIEHPAGFGDYGRRQGNHPGSRVRRNWEAIYLRSLGITVSLSHSQATAAQAQQAFHLGASMVTHAFNAMPDCITENQDYWEPLLCIRMCGAE